ncbi:hypothetical protein Tco_0874692 [Tanacetum coccineum]|uniref:Uncharacterized protein n=1 Tax=Tanacetum coccineum TaxID=301880 RepID=A0ABQ5BMR3_9ASTR
MDAFCNMLHSVLKVFPISVPLYTGGVLEKDPAPHLTARQEQAVQALLSPFGENTYPAFEGPDRTGGWKIWGLLGLYQDADPGSWHIKRAVVALACEATPLPAKKIEGRIILALLLGTGGKSLASSVDVPPGKFPYIRDFLLRRDTFLHHVTVTGDGKTLVVTTSGVGGILSRRSRRSRLTLFMRKKDAEIARLESLAVRRSRRFPLFILLSVDFKGRWHGSSAGKSRGQELYNRVARLVEHVMDVSVSHAQSLWINRSRGDVDESLTLPRGIEYLENLIGSTNSQQSFFQHLGKPPCREDKCPNRGEYQRFNYGFWEEAAFWACEKNYSSVRRYVADPDMLTTNDLSLIFILKGANLLGQASTSAFIFCVEDLDTDEDLGSVLDLILCGARSVGKPIYVGMTASVSAVYTIHASCISIAFLPYRVGDAERGKDKARRPSPREGIRQRLDEESRDWIEELPECPMGHRTKIKIDHAKNNVALAINLEHFIEERRSKQRYKGKKQEKRWKIYNSSCRATSIHAGRYGSTAAMKQVMPRRRINLEPKWWDHMKLRSA